ncbi:MAG: ketoacyl-ACP synthase III [Oligoflexia bacterium]|nr:ketoacyl-ACP synthase III [Oligoflexia bacterium]
MSAAASRILGVGTYVPPRVWSNHDLSRLMDTSDEWIQQRTGIKQRHWVDLNEETGPSDLALKASLKALEAAKTKKEEIELIIFATLSPDAFFPGSGCFLQAKLGLTDVPALDIRQQCSGFIYGLSIADQFIKTGTYKKVLLVGAEVHSKVLDRTTRGRDVSVLFGDGAGAAVIGATDGSAKDGSRVISTHLYADGTHAKELWIKAPGTAYAGDSITHERVDEGDFFPKMNGKTVFVHACKKMSESLTRALEQQGLRPSDVDLYLFHQANARITEAVAKQLELPADKVFNTIDRFANTTAATIPIGMDEAIKAGRLKPGMLVACAVFGAGFTWATALIRW